METKQWKDVLHIISGKNQKTVANPNGKYPIYGSGGIIGYADDYLCEAGTTIVGRKGTINKPIFVDEPFWNIDTAFGVAPGKNLNPKYLYYFCLYFNFMPLDKSTGRPSLAKSDLLKIKMPVPSLSKQEQIVKQIEESLSQLDSAVATLKKTKQQLEIYRLSILNQAFSDNRQMIPFGRITEARLGKMLDKEKNTGKLQRYLRNINVRWFEFDLSDLLEMRIEADEQEKYSITNGDLVICEGGEPGRCAVWENEETIFYQKALHRVRFTDGSNPKYYMYYLWLINKSGALSKYFTGTGIKHLTGQSLTKVLVPQTELSQQDKTVEYIENQFYTFDRIEETINQSLRQTEVLRQSVLKQAFEGD